MVKRRSFSFATLTTIALLIGFVGFGLGFNWDSLSSRWRHRYGSANQQLPEYLDFADVQKVYRALRENFGGELDPTKLLEGAKKGLVEATGDAYTVYLDEAAAKEFRQQLSGKFSGIGAEIAVKKGRLVVVAPLSGSPAEQAGLRSGDYIAKINRESTEGLRVDVAVSKIRGEAGTKVSLTIVRGGGQPRSLTIVRKNLTIPSVNYELKPGRVGYIKLSRLRDQY